MPASPIRKLVPFADEAKKRGIHVYHLNIGQPDIETPEPMLRALKEFNRKVISYTHSQGDPSYLDWLVEYYHKHGIYVRKEDINVTNGGSEAIIFAMMITMNPGDEILIPEPFYTNYNGFARMADVQIVPLTTHGENGFHLPPLEEIEAKITKKTKAILICNPNNPTGTVYTRDELETIAELASKYNLWVLADEVYREFVYDGVEHVSLMSIPQIEKQVIILDSISKRYSACGARVGCLISRNRTVMDACLRMAQARLCSPLVEQVMAAAARFVTDEYMGAIVEEYRTRRDVVFEALSRMDGVLAEKPHGAFYNIVRLPIDDANEFCKWLLKDFSYQSETVMLAPADGFYASAGLGTDEARIAYVLCKEDLARAMMILEKALQEYPGRKE